MRPSTCERSTWHRVAVIGLLLILGCQSDPSTGSTASSESTGPSNTTTMTATTLTTTSGVTAPEVPGEVVAPCEAGDEPVVAAAVAPLGGEMVAASEAVWISSFAAGGIIRVEPETMCPSDAIVVESAPFGLSAMTLAPDGTLYAGAARTGEISVVTPDGQQVNQFPADVNAAGGIGVEEGRLWTVCCDPSQSTHGSSWIYDLAGEAVAEIPIESGRDVITEGESAWIGRRDTGGAYRVNLVSGTVEVEQFEAVGTMTTSLARSDGGVYLVTDEPVLQRFVDGAFQQVVELPFPPDHPIDIAVGRDGSIYAVGPYGPGLIWVTPQGDVRNVLAIEHLTQVEVVGETLWVLSNGGSLARIDTTTLGEQ